MSYGFQILLEEPLNQIGDNYVLNRGHMLTKVKCSKVCFTIGSLGLNHHQAIKMVAALKRMFPPNLARALAKGTVMSCLFLFVCLFVLFVFFSFVLFFLFVCLLVFLFCFVLFCFVLFFSPWPHNHFCMIIYHYADLSLSLRPMAGWG